MSILRLFAIGIGLIGNKMKNVRLLWIAFIIISNLIDKGQCLFAQEAQPTQAPVERLCQVGQEADANNQGKLRWMTGTDSTCSRGFACDKFVLGGVDVKVDRKVLLSCPILHVTDDSTPRPTWPSTAKIPPSTTTEMPSVSSVISEQRSVVVRATTSQEILTGALKSTPNNVATNYNPVTQNPTAENPAMSTTVSKDMIFTATDILSSAKGNTLTSSGTDVDSTTSSQNDNGATSVINDITSTTTATGVVTPTKGVTSSSSGTTLVTGVTLAYSEATPGGVTSITNSFTRTSGGLSLTPSGAISTTKSTASSGSETSTKNVASIANGTTSTTNVPLYRATPVTVNHMSSTPETTSSSSAISTQRGPTISEKPVTSLPPSVNIPVFRDCTEARDNGYTISGLYNLSLLGVVSPFWCDMDIDDGGWMVLQRREDGSVDFNRTWEEYKAGFGTPNGECWIGNYAMEQITNAYKFELRIDLYDWEGNHAYASYSQFKITGVKYALDIKAYKGTAGDSLSYGDGHDFSTIDMDNDNSLNNCMGTYGGGWWTNNCFDSNLNSYYHQSSALPDSKGIVWAAWKGISYALKKTEMKMRMTAAN